MYPQNNMISHVQDLSSFISLNEYDFKDISSIIGNIDEPNYSEDDYDFSDIEDNSNYNLDNFEF